MRSIRQIPILIVVSLALMMTSVLAAPATLPETAPVPPPNATAPQKDRPDLETVGQDLPKMSSEIPVPEARPGEDGEPDRPDPASAPSTPPIPGAKPENPSDEQPAPPAKPAPPPDPRSAVRADPSGKLPADELACRASLRSLGVAFKEHPAETDPAGCSIPYPIVITSLGTGVGLEPQAEMNCAMAESSARFMQDFVASAAKAELGEELKSISHASAYVCRPRNGTTKLSEHAFGNALDIAAFIFADDTRIEIGPVQDERAAKLLAAIRKAACGPFKTVLGPGSDPDHARHFHFDLAPRKNGGTFCQ